MRKETCLSSRPYANEKQQKDGQEREKERKKRRQTPHEQYVSTCRLADGLRFENFQMIPGENEKGGPRMMEMEICMRKKRRRKQQQQQQ
jgi:hypothetical protein